MRLLIIEDEEKTAKSLQLGLEENSYTVDLAYDGLSGIDQLKENLYDMVVLDIMLPQIDGWQILDWIRKRDKKLPVLLLTALNSVPDKVKGLQIGADDYLSKPFAFSEFLARIEAILRRTKSINFTDMCQIEDLQIFLTSQTVTRQGARIELTQKEFQLICLLAENAGKLVFRKDLCSKLWGLDFNIDTNALEVSIRRLRKKIDEPFETSLIHTVRGGGYYIGRQENKYK